MFKEFSQQHSVLCFVCEVGRLDTICTVINYHFPPLSPAFPRFSRYSRFSTPSMLSGEVRRWRARIPALLSNGSRVMVEGFRTYSTTVFVCTSLPLPFVPALSSLSASTPLMQNSSFPMPKTWHCEHAPKCASANACRAKRCRQKEGDGQHEAQARKYKKEARFQKMLPTQIQLTNCCG